MRAWVNGSLLADAEAPSLPATDRGFLLGDGVFEAAKVVDGVPFALTRHLARLVEAAERVGLPAPDTELVRRGVRAVLEAEPLALGRLRITYTAGSAPLGPARSHGAPTIAIVASPMGPATGGVDVVTAPWPRNERSPLAGVKSTSYAENVIAQAYAHERGAAEALLPNLAGDVCEGTTSNVFYAVGGELRTPTLASGCLPGITRALLLQWCDVREVDEPMSVLGEAEEIFLASTTRDVQPVRRLDGRDLGEPGPVTTAAAGTWRRREEEDPDP